MNYLEKKRAENAGHPRGFWGRKTLRAMNRHHDALTDWGLSFLTVNDGDRILDVGCGGGRTVKKLSRATTETVWGVDLSSAAIEEAFRANRRDIRRDKVIICKADVADLPFDAETFDVVTAVETIYFWPDLTAGLKEICRVMKGGGRLMLLTESRGDGEDAEKWAEVAKTAQMERLPSADGTAAALKEAGFVGIVAHVRGDFLCVTAEKPR